MPLSISLALFASFLWALTSHIDKILLCHIDKSKNTLKTLLLFSTLIAGSILSPIWLIISNFNIKIKITSLILIFTSALIYVLANYFYYKALEKNDTTIIAIMFQLLPVFSFIMGFILFDESLSLNQTIGAIAIIISAIFLIIDFNGNKEKNKLIAFFLIFLSALLHSFYFILFELAMKSNSYTTVAFWYQIGLFIIGIFLLLFKSCRKELVLVLTKGKRFIYLNIFNELIDLIANLLINFVNLTIPIALVNTLNGFEGIFVFLIGVIGTIFLPKYFKEDLTKNTLIQKIGCTILSVLGLLILMK